MTYESELYEKIFITLISKKHNSFFDTSLERIDENTIIKLEEDGSLLPHFYVDYDEIEGLFKGFKIHRIRHIEDFYNNTSSWHYSVHASKL